MLCFSVKILLTKNNNNKDIKLRIQPVQTLLSVEPQGLPQKIQSSPRTTTMTDRNIYWLVLGCLKHI